MAKATLDDIEPTIDPINYIIQDVIRSVAGYELEAKNNLRVFPDYSLDVIKPKKNTYRLNIRTEFMKNICTIMIDKTGFVVKYSTAFYMQYYKTKTLSEYRTNVITGVFQVKDIPVIFPELDLLKSINFEEMLKTLHLCKRLYDEIDFG